MGKVEILTLIAGVVLSIALALIVVPMFGTSENVVNKQKINAELIGVKEAIKMVHNTEPEKIKATADTDTYKALKVYLKGMDMNQSGASINSISSTNVTGMNYTVAKASAAGIDTITITVSGYPTSGSLLNVYEDKSSFDKICTDNTSAITASGLTCKYILK